MNPTISSSSTSSTWTPPSPAITECGAPSPPNAFRLSLYVSIITWEFITATLCWWGVTRLLQARKGSAAFFQKSKSLAIGALTFGCLMWFVAFMSVGAEWFLMWQSRTWNGQEAAFRMFAILGIVLIYLAMPDPDLEST